MINPTISKEDVIELFKKYSGMYLSFKFIQKSLNYIFFKDLHKILDELDLDTITFQHIIDDMNMGLMGYKLLDKGKK